MKTSNFHTSMTSMLPAHLPEIIKSKGWDISINILWFDGFLTLRWYAAGCCWKGLIPSKCSGDMKIPHRLSFKGNVSISLLCFMKLPLKFSCLCHAVPGPYLSKKYKRNKNNWASSTGLTAVSKFKPRLPAQWAVGTHRKGSSRMEKVTSRINWPIRNSTQIRIRI